MPVQDTTAADQPGIRLYRRRQPGPDGQAGVANMVSSLMDEGAGDWIAHVPRTPEDKAIELSFRVGRDYFNGSLRAQRASQYRRIDAPGADRAARGPGHRSHPRADPPGCSATPPVPTSSAAGAGGDGVSRPSYGREVNGTLESLPSAPTTCGLCQNSGARRLKIAIVGNLDAAAAGAWSINFGALPAKPSEGPAVGRGSRSAHRHRLDVPQPWSPSAAAGYSARIGFHGRLCRRHILGGGTFPPGFTARCAKRGLAYGISDSLIWLKGTALIIGGDRHARRPPQAKR